MAVAILNDQRMRGLRQLWRSGEGPSLVAALLFCVITAWLMVKDGLLPADDGYGIVGILFIYATIFVLVGRDLQDGDQAGDAVAGEVSRREQRRGLRPLSVPLAVRPASFGTPGPPVL